MRIGYACTNGGLECKKSGAAPESEERRQEVLAGHLDCLATLLERRLAQDLKLLHVPSSLVCVAGEAPCRERLQELGRFLREHGMRVSLHPGRFASLDSEDETEVERRLAELWSHARLLEDMELDCEHKIQLRAGSNASDKAGSLELMARRIEALPDALRRRLAVENDEHRFSLSDCLWLHSRTGIPVVLDCLAHQVNNDETTLREAFGLFTPTWQWSDGLPLADYSSQEPNRRPGVRAATLDALDFRSFLLDTRDYAFDVMLAVRDKEVSALRALRLARSLGIG